MVFARACMPGMPNSTPCGRLPAYTAEKYGEKAALAHLLVLEFLKRQRKRKKEKEEIEEGK
jgi:hypothetical protein